MTRKNFAIRCLPILFALQWASSASAQAAGLEVDPALKGPPSASMSMATYKGKPALHVTDISADGAAAFIPLSTQGFQNGTIIADVTGQPRPGAPEYARGFLGVAFRVAGDNRYEAFYVRPTNGRSNDQLRRNHTAQYISAPDFDWERLRVEYPGKYEGYANVAPGEWSRLRILVEGQTAQLFIDDEEQPSLIVNDLKLGADGSGGVALWAGPFTDAYFANVTVTPAN
jgi:hypothetical protein